LYNGVQGMVEAIYAGQEQRIEALCRSQEAFQQQVVELSWANAGLRTEIAEIKAAEAKMRQQNAYLTGLQETSLVLMNCLEPIPVLETVLHHASELLAAPQGYIGLVTGETLEIKVGVGIYNARVGSQKKRGEGLAGKV